MRVFQKSELKLDPTMPDFWAYTLLLMSETSVVKYYNILS